MVLRSLLLLVLALHTLAAEKPNIVVILSDDMGFSDLGCYGGEIQTPHLDSLAAGGVRFTQFYNTARCCPTRASLLTGLHPHQAGIGHMTSDNGHDGYRGVLNDRCVTLAEALAPAGYRAYMCGKWHVTRHSNVLSDNASWPIQRGFEKFYGTITGAGSFYDPATLCRQNTYITPENDAAYKPAQYYYTDAISDNAVKFLKDHAADSKDKPFFLYLAYTAAHWPMHALEKDIVPYKGRYDGGYHPIRQARFERMKQMGLISRDLQLSPAAEDWSKVSDKAWEARCMEVYAAMVDSMDQGIGRVIAQLKSDGRFDNTLILYLQDNGGCAEGMGRGASKAPANVAPMKPDQLQPQIWPPMQTRDGRVVKSGPSVMPGPADTYVGYGRGWANVSNTPFREYKHWTHEGGISTPLIAHWPAGIPAQRRGALEHQPGQLVDIMATCIDLSGAAYPEKYKGQSIKPLEGTSLRAAFTGEALPRTKPLVWEHEGNRAIRDGKWKLVAMENKPWELYDIETDRTEATDLAAKEQERVKAMSAQWDAWAARADVLPQGAWRGKGGAAENKLSAERRFVLKAGDQLPRAKAPAIAGRAFTITAKFDPAEARDGVIIAQGGSANGYVLFLADGKLTFLIRAASQTASATTREAIAGLVTAIARVDPDGAISLKVDDQPPIAGDRRQLISTMPADPLDVGSDTAGAVGPYTAPHAFKGKIELIVVELDGPK